VQGDLEAVADSIFPDLVAGKLARRYQGSLLSMASPSFSYPYCDEDFRGELKNRYVYYESSKGCPFACTYCLSSAHPGVYRKELDTVRDELGRILKFGPQTVRFIDRTFNDLPERALAIWQYLAENGGKTLFHFEMAPDRFTPEMLDFLRSLAPGKFQFELGIQSFTPSVLAAVGRRIDLEKAEANLRQLRAYGTVHLHVDLILGLPQETRQTFRDSLSKLFQVGPHYMQLGLLKILPQTPIARSVEDDGYIFSQQPPYPVLMNKWLSHKEMSDLYWLCESVEKFYNNRYFTSFWEYLRGSGEDGASFFEKLYGLCLAQDFFSLAATQELMCRLLVELCRERTDVAVIMDLLRYDWLRCNNRFLPDCLELPEDREAPVKTRSRLYQSLPAELDGCYTRATRNQFFRKTYLLSFSEEALRFLLPDDPEQIDCLGFTGSREPGILSHNRVVVIRCSAARS
jgi:hypothetical protein